MSSEWIETDWGSIATLEYGKGLRDYRSGGGAYPVYGTNGQVGHCESFLCPHSGIVVGRKGAYRGIHYSANPFYVIDTAYWLKPKIDLDLKWAYYELLRQDINSLDSGSAIPSTTRDAFYSLDVFLPPIEEQKAIAHILGTLDEKIELNRKTNETLEAMAKALFKSWFVDFDPVRAKAEGRPTGLPAEISDLFPDSFEDSELGEIPSGWEIKAISNLCQSISSGGTPSRKNSEYWIGGTISWFKTGELRDSFLLESEERITQAGLNESSCKYFDKGDILFALYGATVGKMGIVTAPSTANQAAACLRPLEEVGTPFLEGMLYATRERLMNIATGAAQQNLYLGVVKEHAVVAPCKPLPKMFSQLVDPINQRRLCCLKESSSLSSFRNALLPKLISGEIRIPDAEKMLEEVGV